jgi:hypothetical protein
MFGLGSFSKRPDAWRLDLAFRWALEVSARTGTAPQSFCGSFAPCTLFSKLCCNCLPQLTVTTSHPCMPNKLPCRPLHRVLWLPCIALVPAHLPAATSRSLR